MRVKLEPLALRIGSIQFLVCFNVRFLGNILICFNESGESPGPSNKHAHSVDTVRDATAATEGNSTIFLIISNCFINV
jgi:hypothetical protein